jgi:hypothetical protein
LYDSDVTIAVSVSLSFLFLFPERGGGESWICCGLASCTGGTAVTFPASSSSSCRQGAHFMAAILRLRVIRR